MSRLNEFIDLDRPEIARLASHYGLTDLEEVTPVRKGLINTNYRIRAHGGDYLLRLLPAERTRDAVVFELSTLRRLAEYGFPCPRPLLPTTGEWGFSIEHERHFVVFEYIEGQTLAREQIDRRIVGQVGELFGRMQKVLEGFVPEGGKPSADLEYVDGLKSEVCRRLSLLPSEGNSIAIELERIWNRSYAAMRSRELAQGFVHADLYFDNVIVEGSEIRGIIDFDDSYHGSLVVDLAVVLMEFGFVTDGELDLELSRLLLEAYYRMRPGSVMESDLIVDAMTCACYKYLGYTSNLDSYAGIKLLENEYIARIRYLAGASVRQRLQETIKSVTASMEAS